MYGGEDVMWSLPTGGIVLTGYFYKFVRSCIYIIIIIIGICIKLCLSYLIL